MEQARGDSLQLAVLWGRPGLEAIAAEWRVLGGRCAHPSFAHLPEWYRAYLTCMAPDADAVCFCALRRRGRLEAVVPLERRMRREAGLPCRVLTLPQDAALLPAGDFTVAADVNVSDVVRALLQGVAGLPALRWDCIDVEFVPESACSAAAMRAAPCTRRFIRSTGCRDRVMLQPYHDLVRSLSRRTKSHLRTGRNRVAAAGGAQYAVVDDGPDLGAALDLLIDVEASGWKGRDGTAVKHSPALRAFYAAVADGFGALGACDVLTMTVGGRPIAAELVLKVGDTAFFLKGGYDEDYRHLGPGHRIFEFAMRHYYEKTDIRCLDLLGAFEYMRIWKPIAEQEYSLTIFDAAWTGTVACGSMRLKHGVRQAYGRTLRPWARKAGRAWTRLTERAGPGAPSAGKRCRPGEVCAPQEVTDGVLSRR